LYVDDAWFLAGYVAALRGTDIRSPLRVFLNTVNGSVEVRFQVSESFDQSVKHRLPILEELLIGSIHL